jgi:very-short-patch-repair endonuclease
VSRTQLLAAGFSRQAIEHRIARGRLHRLFPGVYAVGRPDVNQHGRWMAAVLACGPRALISHGSAAALWAIRASLERRIHVSVPAPLAPRTAGIAVHRRARLGPADVTKRHGIPVTSPALTLVDLALSLTEAQLEAAINEADKLDLIDPEALRSAVDRMPSRPGRARLREILDRLTLTLTDSELERLFLPIVRRADLPAPRTQQTVSGFRVDFFWPELGLVVETDGLRYHRTPAEQARDRIRDQAHVAAGLTCLRFTNAQVRFEPDRVERTLRTVAVRLAGSAA